MRDPGGKAFPRPRSHLSMAQDGMTLREYYVGQVIIGLLSTLAHPQSNGLADFPQLATRAGALADAMLLERKNIK